MSAALLLEQYPTRAELDAVIVTIHASDLTGGGTGQNLQVGDRWSLWQLFANMVVPSSNNASIALARSLAGSESAFVAGMNAKAAALGMSSTVYASAHGNENAHTTTASDVARLLGHAPLVDNAVLRDLCRQTRIFVDISRGRVDLRIYPVFNHLVSEPGVVVRKSGESLGPTGQHLAGLRHMANGEDVSIVTLEARTTALALDDQRALYDALLRDFPELGAPLPQPGNGDPMAFATNDSIDVFGQFDTVTTTGPSVTNGNYADSGSDWTNDEDASEAGFVLAATPASSTNVGGRSIHLFTKMKAIQSTNDAHDPSDDNPVVRLGSFRFPDNVATEEFMPLEQGVVKLPNYKSSQIHRFWIKNDIGQTINVNWKLYISPQGVGPKPA